MAYLIPLYEHLLAGQKVTNELNRPRNANTFKGQIVRDPLLTPVARPFVLIVVPTRELAIQIYSDMADLALGTLIQPAALYGGTSREDQASMLSRGCDILIATPGRLIDMLQGSFLNGVKTLSLNFISHIVWDEADELLSAGFADQMQVVIDLALLNTPPVHHWFFSSQYEDEHIQKAKTLIDSKYLNITFDMPENSAAIRYSAVKQIFIKVSEDHSERFNALKKIFGKIGKNPNTKCIVLCQTHAMVKELHSRLATLRIPFRSTHGGCSQEEREEAMFRFKKGHVPLLVSTMGVSGRGINLQGANCLIFWDMPEAPDQYKWCLGRVRR